MTLNDIPREEIPWFPTMDENKCDGCKVCFDFCAYGVYTWDEKKEIAVVKNPYNCMVGCNYCESMCKPGAISFPDLSILRELKKFY